MTKLQMSQSKGGAIANNNEAVPLLSRRHFDLLNKELNDGSL